MKRFLNGCATSPYLAAAFDALGWDAWTCDLLPGEWHKHIQDDVRNHLHDDWQLAVFHPDCRYLANSGVRWRVERGEYCQIKEAATFFNTLESVPYPHVVENPIQHKYARWFIRKPDQIIQPWQFGLAESKAMCLWLTDVKPLASRISRRPEDCRQTSHRLPPTADRWQVRSRNFLEVSFAMALAWGR